MLHYSDEVRCALENCKPVVALESTLIAHGFPYPDNYQLALELEGILRQEGVAPATIALLDGKIKVGLTQEEIHHIASAGAVRKASLRDIPIMAALGLDGGTTVASTMQIAHWAGIKVFVTGGIGGVHRHGHETFDISADLQALLLQCYGGLCWCQIRIRPTKTLEVLETLGVPVIGYKTQQFPAFTYETAVYQWTIRFTIRTNSPSVSGEGTFTDSRRYGGGGTHTRAG